jgi:predicted lysophospholipase L1 biosynthesis ABC-type transport system permease subunit
VRALQVADVLDLAAIDSEDAEDRLQKVFEWDFERTMTSIRLVFGAAGSVVVALLAALFRPDSELKTWHIVAILGFAGVLAIVGVSMLWRMRTNHRRFVAALQLLSTANHLGPLLKLYRSGGGS